MRKSSGIVGAVVLGLATPAVAQSNDVATVRAELNEARSEIERQRKALEAQDARIRALEARLTTIASQNVPAAAPPARAGEQVASVQQQDGLEQVGVAPLELQAPPVAVLGDQGNIITRAGQLTAEAQIEYARADRNRTLFRGIELVEAILIGIFDINESRQDVLTFGAGLRYGITSGMEAAVRVPFVYRSDKSIITPILGTTNEPDDMTIDSSTSRTGIGDIEFQLRHQLTPARPGSPFLIGNFQVVAPTGSDPFEVPRDGTGRALKAATGAGFWSVSPSLTAILPSDPAVLFGTLGYTHSFARDANTVIPPVEIERVWPGDSFSASVGIGISLNPRTSFNLGYAHSWSLGTKTRTRLLDPLPEQEEISFTRSRDLQVGRFLFGMAYRINDLTTINWSIELGATDDATDIRTVLRIPIVLIRGR